MKLNLANHKISFEEAAKVFDDPNRVEFYRPRYGESRAGQASSLPAVKRLRQQFGISQDAFAKRFKIPLGTLRDWEQGRAEPDATAQTCIQVIERDPVAKLATAA